MTDDNKKSTNTTEQKIINYFKNILYYLHNLVTA